MVDFASIKSFLLESGYECELNKSFGGLSAPIELFAKKKGHGWWIFFPYVDFLFFHDLSSGRHENAKALEQLHEEERNYVNKLFKMPRLLRYTVPNIVTVALCEKGFSSEVIEYARKQTFSIIGGEKHSIHLIDLAKKKLFNHGLEVVRASGFDPGGAVATVAIAHKKVNPSNRIYHLMSGLVAKLWP